MNRTLNWAIEHNPVELSLSHELGKPRDAGSIYFWWLGQAGFALRYKEHLLLIDPYLSDSLFEKYRDKELKHQRLMPIPVAPDEITDCDWVFCTHGHSDHMDATTIQSLGQASSPAFVTPRSEVQKAMQRGVPSDQLVSMNANEQLYIDEDLNVTAIASAHESLERDTDGNHRYLGYIFNIAGLRIYHSGDCVPYDSLEATLREQTIDIALLPINGRDEFRTSRGVPGNFTVQEAASLCTSSHIPYLVGHHFGMFDFNTIDQIQTEHILQQASDKTGLRWLIPEIMVTYRITVQS